ncbi:MAG TPA: MFS transporter, partial [Candidatus Limnocylindrales bacterium]|nr:MFS transporter [Candidatus Limnocylindrales bacterium]
MTGERQPGPASTRAYKRFTRDARLILVTSLVAGAALSLWWIDFNLYLVSLGYSSATIGLVSTLSSLAGGIIAFPASAWSDRVGRRVVFYGGLIAGIVALVALLASEALVVVILAAALWSMGFQAFQVVISPYMTEHSEPDHRNELFAVQFAIQNVTNIVAAILGGFVATAIAAWMGMPAGGPGTYRIILVIMLVLSGLGLLSVARLTDDRPSRTMAPRLRSLGEPAAFPADPRRSRTFLGITVRDRARFAKLLIPGLLISIGAGQIIPFLNVYIQAKFELNLAQLNAVFALTSLGTVLAIMAQPWLARRFGQITSVVLVQGLSIPFLVVLGFSPILWTVITAMMVRNSLMNAGNPIFNAFAMEQVTPAERASLSAAMSVLWQVGWVIGGTWYAVLQATVGFYAGYTVNFITIITLYSIATALYWIWFREADRRALRA